jgi:hypothetical protein
MIWDALENKLDGADSFGEMGREPIPPYVGNPTLTAIAVSTGARSMNEKPEPSVANGWPLKTARKPDATKQVVKASIPR